MQVFIQEEMYKYLQEIMQNARKFLFNMEMMDTIQ